MDYPVLVNPGKPPLKDAHEEENKVDRFGHLQNAAKAGGAGRKAAPRRAPVGGRSSRRRRSPPTTPNRAFAG